MAITPPPLIPELPPAPQRHQMPIDYALTADTWAGAWGRLTGQVNAATAWTNGIGLLVKEYSEDTKRWRDETEVFRNEAKTSATNAAKSEVAAKKHLDDTIAVIQTFDPTGTMPPSTVEGAPLVVATAQGGVRFDDRPLTDVAFTSNAGLYDSFFSPPVIVASAYTAKHRDTVIINTTTAEVTVKLPASPAVNTRVRFVDYFGGWSKRNATVDRNGQRIAGVLENLILNVKGGNPTLIYTGSTYGWAVA